MPLITRSIIVSAVVCIVSSPPPSQMASFAIPVILADSSLGIHYRIRKATVGIFYLYQVLPVLRFAVSVPVTPSHFMV